MTEHYNAFISYKHAPEDNKVADAVHKGLERYHIPGKLRKKTGIKRINRIFRDKAELPITNDLSDNISAALEDADYLIVLCSTNTKESAWVPREIEYFLKNHSKRDVFTVLVNGEPHDVIPEILQYEEKVITNENGIEQTVRIPIEPLSCDYRMPFSKAKKTELPRLVCGIIGCAYDELMNRRRQYKIKQMAAAFSVVLAVVLGFAGYMLYSRNKIHETYLESLKNQSRYLANESGNLLEKEQRITALQLALEALPKDDSDERPVTAEAIKAITDATLAYESSDGVNIHAVWNYTMPNTISDFTVSKDGKTLAIVDKESVVGVWDTESHNRIMYFDNIESKVCGIAFPDDSCFILWTENTVFCYDISSGNQRWECSLTDDKFEDKSTFMLSDKVFYICTQENHFPEIEIASGKMKNELVLPEKAGHSDLSPIECKLSPDGKRIAFRCLIDLDKYTYGIFDINTKNLQVSENIDAMIKDIDWIGDDALMIASAKIDLTRSMSFDRTYILSTDTTNIKCINPTNLSERWTKDFICNGVNINSGFFALGKDTVSYHSGNVVSVYDLLTGTEKYKNNVNDAILDVSDRDGDGNPLYITENGGYASPALDVDTDAAYFTKYFPDNLRQVIINKGVYTRQVESNEIIYYNVGIYDHEWEPLDKDIILKEGIPDFYLKDDHLATLSGGNVPMLTIFDLNTNKATQTALDGENIYKYTLLGIYKDQVYLRYDKVLTHSIITVSTSDTAETKELFEVTSNFEKTFALYGSKLIYCATNDDYKSALFVYDIDTNDKKEIELPEDLIYTESPAIYNEKDNTVNLEGIEDEYCFDLNNNTVSKVEDTSNYLGATPVGTTCIDNSLLVLFNDGSLNQYDKDSNEFIKKIDVSVYKPESASFEYDEENKLLYIQIGQYTSVVDIEGGVQIAHIGYSLGYSKNKDVFYTINGEADGSSQVGFYKHYSVDDLIDKAHEMLGDAELSKEMKSRYGISFDE